VTHDSSLCVPWLIHVCSDSFIWAVNHSCLPWISHGKHEWFTWSGVDLDLISSVECSTSTTVICSRLGLAVQPPDGPCDSGTHTHTHTQRHTRNQESQKGDSFWGSPFWEESQKESPFWESPFWQGKKNTNKWLLLKFELSCWLWWLMGRWDRWPRSLSVARLWVADGGCDLVQASARGRGPTFSFRGRTVTWRRGSADLVVASTEHTWVLANCGSVWGRGRYSTLAAGSSIRGCWWWVYQVAYLGAVNKVAPFGVADGGCTYYNMYKDSPLIYITCMSYIRTRWYADSHTDILYVFCMHV